MPTFVKFLGAELHGKNLSFRLGTEDKQAYEFDITPKCFTDLFSTGWRAAADLPEVSPEQGQTATMEAQVQVGILDMKPALLLMSGPLILALGLDAPGAVYLASEMHKLATAAAKDQKH